VAFYPTPEEEEADEALALQQQEAEEGPEAKPRLNTRGPCRPGLRPAVRRAMACARELSGRLGSALVGADGLLVSASSANDSDATQVHGRPTWLFGYFS
jgi:hypothetical protein